MRIAVLSDTRQPTVPTGNHGLGRFAYSIADGLAKRGHSVILHAGVGSIAPAGVELIEDADESERARTWYQKELPCIDLSHSHGASYHFPELPIVNWIADVECNWHPPNAVVGNEWQKEHFPTARIIRAGVDVRNIPFRDKPDEPKYLAFCAKLHPAKGCDLAIETARRAGIPLRLVGQKYIPEEIPGWEGEITDNDALWRFLGGAYALLAPSRLDAGGLVVLQAAACGTPVITLDCTGTQYHVKHCVSGFICYDVVEMVEAVQDLSVIERAWCRDWVAETHSMGGMISALETMCEAVVDGERW